MAAPQLAEVVVIIIDLLKSALICQGPTRADLWLTPSAAWRRPGLVGRPGRHPRRIAPAHPRQRHHHLPGEEHGTAPPPLRATLAATDPDRSPPTQDPAVTLTVRDLVVSR
jgi:hypothetical protein